MSKLFKNYIGIDISKKWFDAAFISSSDPTLVEHKQFNQSRGGYREMSEWLDQQKVLFDDQTLFCMEYTGLYNTGLVNYLVEHNGMIWVEMALRIKKAGGFERGADDKSAAAKIALYALRYQDQAKLWKPADSSIERIKHLVAQRDRIVDCVTQLSVPVKELKECGSDEEAK